MKTSLCKRLLALTATLALVLASFAVVTVSVSALDENEKTEGDYIYMVPDGTAIITKYTGAGGDVTIPSKLGGYPVTSIGMLAFSNCTGLTSVTIPDGVIPIGNRAFYGCTGLTTVTIPDSVTSIGYDVFTDTAWINAQPDGLVYAGKVVYQYKGTMPDNTTVTLKSDTKGIARSAFLDCTGLTAITLPDGVVSIKEYAFSGCTNLKAITIPDSVEYVGGGAFCDCTGLMDVALPDSVTSIEEKAFMGCTGLTEITIPDSVTDIWNSAFEGCTGLKAVTVPASVTNIGYHALGYVDYDNKIEGFILYGTPGTMAETYATENGITFVPVSTPTTTTTEAPTTTTTVAPSDEIDMMALEKIVSHDNVTITEAADGSWVMEASAAASIGIAGCGVYDAATLQYLHFGIVSEVPFTVAFYDGVNNKWMTSAGDFFPDFGGAADQPAPAGTHTLALWTNGCYTWDGSWLPDTVELSSIYIEPQAAGTMVLSTMKLSSSSTYDGITPTQPLPTTTTETPTTTTIAPITTTTAGGSYEQGDINRDNTIDMRDARLLFQYVSGAATLDAEQLALGDVTGRGVTDMLDARKLFQMAAGN